MDYMNTPGEGNQVDTISMVTTNQTRQENAPAGDEQVDRLTRGQHPQITQEDNRQNRTTRPNWTLWFRT